MREENVDGGFLVTQGVYTGLEDYNKTIVRQLMVQNAPTTCPKNCLTMLQIERRMAPFWRGLNDHSDSWTENQLLAAAKGRPIPAPDEIPAEEQDEAPAENETQERSSKKNIKNLMVPISSRSQSFTSDSSSNLSPGNPTFGVSAPSVPAPASSSGVALFRGRAKTLASLTTSSKAPQPEMMPREMNLPKDPFINGQVMEAYLYKDAAECPICFLYYPPYLNKTRCCDQAICSECFVQIKRPDPHVPEHGDPTAAPPPAGALPNMEPDDGNGDNRLVSEPAACPFCVQPEFGVTYDPPPFRRGLTYVNQTSTHPLANATEAMSSSSSLASAMSGGGQISQTGFARRRTTSLSAASPTVISTDRIRPDWHQKLASARAIAARRSAAATALHTAAYLMGNHNHDSDGRAFSGFARRNILRRATGGSDSSHASAGSSHLNMLAMMSERHAASAAGRREGDGSGDGRPSMAAIPPRGSRRSRIDDLEDMMMMEAIRLSLASEEDRRKREEKEAKKEAKKKEKESKKAEKSARKAGVYQSSAHPSSTAFGDARSPHDSVTSEIGKIKGIQQIGTGQSSARSSNADLMFTGVNSSSLADSSMESAPDHLERARAPLQPHETTSVSTASPQPANPYRPSHLRTLSNASSTVSSTEDHAAGSLQPDLPRSNSSLEASPSSSSTNIARRSSTQDPLLSINPSGGGAGTEPMFNFRSLAAMVGENERAGNAGRVADGDGPAGEETGMKHERGESSTSPPGHQLRIDATSTQSDEKGSLVEEGNDAPPEVQITAASRVNSDLDGRNEGSGLKSAEAAVSVSSARSISP